MTYPPVLYPANSTFSAQSEKILTMPSIRLRTLIAVSGTFVLLLPNLAEAQIVRRFAGGGIQVNAPFVRVNIGPGGATSVRAPFIAVDSPGRTFLGRRWFLAQPRYVAPQRRVPPRTLNTSARPERQPDAADVDALPYPTTDELAVMDDATLVETLRQMMARLHYRLSRLKTGAGWQSYLVLSREILGSPGAPPEAAQFEKVQNILPKFASVQESPEFVKISALPSFVATFAALRETARRFAPTTSSGPKIPDPNIEDPASIEEPPVEEPLEILPTPKADVVPNAKRGERSILKRK